MIAAPTSASRQPGRVVILCSTAWGIRNVVLSGVLDALRGDLDVQLLTSDAARNALSERCDAVGQEPLCNF
jgi:hypothetical protein